jgi:hypothetical protein
LRAARIGGKGRAMRALRVSSVLLSGLVVYYVMAACSGSGGSGGGASSGSSGPPPRSSGDADGSSGVVPNAMADQWYASGSRLKLRYFDGEDGSKQFFDWHDSSRNEDCTIQQHADGSWRCLPASQLVASTGSYYAAGCTAPLAIAFKGTQPKYAFFPDLNAGYHPHVLQLGALVTGTVYVGTPASCTSTTPPAFYDVYATGAELPSTDFVGATPKVAP